MLLFTLTSQNFTKVRLTFLSMAASVKGCWCLDVNYNQPAYLPEFNHTRDWSKGYIFDCGISLDNLESQPKSNSGWCRKQQAVPIT